MEYRVVIIDDEAWTRDTIRRIGHWHEFGFQIVGKQQTVFPVWNVYGSFGLT